jgi:thiol-disulfide isomerase/thioredoxin
MSIKHPATALLLAGITTLAAGYGVHLWLDSQPSEKQPTRQAHPEPLRQLPLFSLLDLEGRTRFSNEWLGKVLVINFWATWCPPCRSEMPEFIELQNVEGSSGLQFVGIAIDSPDPVKEFAKSIGVNYPILIGDTDAISLSESLGNRFSSLPFTVVFDRTGKLVYRKAGEIDRRTLEELVTPLL